MLFAECAVIHTLSTIRTAPARTHLICFSHNVLSTADSHFWSSLAGKQISFNLRRLSLITWILWMSKNNNSTFWYASSDSYLCWWNNQNIISSESVSHPAFSLIDLPPALGFIGNCISAWPSIHYWQFMWLSIGFHNAINVMLVFWTTFTANPNQRLWTSCDRRQWARMDPG